MPFQLPNWVTKAIAGKAVAEKSDQRRIEKNIKETGPALLEEARKAERERLNERKAKNNAPATTLSNDNIIGLSAFSGNITEAQKKRSYSQNNVWDAETHGKFTPPFPKMVGMGRYRRAEDADDDHQVSMLHRAMSNLPDEVVDAAVESHLGSPVGEFDPAVLAKYKEKHRASNTSSTQPAANTSIDSKRGCPVVRGFEPVRRHS